MQQERYHGLDCVRATAMLLGLLLHVCIYFMPVEHYFWWSGEYEGDPLNLAFLNFIHLFRMQLFFLMAGFFAELVIDRKGMAHIVRDRIKRIFVPFVIGIVFLMPVFFFVINLGGFYSNELDGLTLSERFTSLILWGTFTENVEIKSLYADRLMHFWFLYYLLLIYLIHFTLRVSTRSFIHPVVNMASRFITYAIKHKFGFLLLGLLSFPFQYSLVSVFFPPSGYNVPLNDLAFYLFYYLSGALLYKNKHLLEVLSSHCWLYLVLSIPFFLYTTEATQRLDESAPVIRDITTWAILDVNKGHVSGWNLWYEGIFHSGWNKVAVVIIRVQLCWLMCFAFIGLAHRYLKTSSPFISYLSESAYWAFWIHPIITSPLSKIAQQLEYVNSLTKCYLVLITSIVIIYWSYNTFVRYTILGDFFMGRRKQRQESTETPFAILSLGKRLAPGVIVLGLLIFILGSLFQYNHQFSTDRVLVESYVGRKQATMNTVISVGGITDKYGNTPLHVATRMKEGLRRYNTVAVLLEKTNEIDSQNCYGRTALFNAVRTGNLEDVKLLMSAGADPDIADIHGHTPAHVAAIKTGMKNDAGSQHYVDILEVLVKEGARMELRDAKGRTVGDCLQQFSGRNIATS